MGILAGVGRSLVIQVQRVSEKAVKHSQRSFELPESADVGAVHAVYNAADGLLSVDIPLKPRGVKGKIPCKHSSHAYQERLQLLEDGSQTTITFSHGETSRDEDAQLFNMLMDILPSRHI